MAARSPSVCSDNSLQIDPSSLWALRKAGYDGSLLDVEGATLCGDDEINDTQEYRLVLCAPRLPGVHCL